MNEPNPPTRGTPLRIDAGEESADPSLPGFLARPAGAPVYYGFPLLPDSRTEDGWCFGVISDPDCPEGRVGGDAFVVAPDNSRAGLIWQVGPPAIEVTIPPEPDRWGVYSIGVPRPVRTQDELIEQLRVWLPELRRRHEAWKATSG